MQASLTEMRRALGHDPAERSRPLVFAFYQEAKDRRFLPVRLLAMLVGVRRHSRIKQSRYVSA